MGRRCPSSLLILCAAAATVTAAVVEVGSLTTVTVEAPLYDTNLSAAGGCDPAGCSGDKTRVSLLVVEMLLCNGGDWTPDPDTCCT